METRAKPAGDINLNLALQGGGSHGAFTWGVLDKLLEDGRFHLTGVSGTSAGAMNAVCLADGMHANGKQGARDKLRRFWEAVGERGRFAPPMRTPLDIWLGNWNVGHSPVVFYDNWLKAMYSPYDNPFPTHPLRDLVNEVVDFDNIHACDSMRVFVAATNVWNGKVRVFENAEIVSEAVLASACLPQVFRAVEIDGVPYWDGGYMGNPVLFPFFYQTRTEDLLIVQINPIERMETPKTAQEIANRVDEITFNASLLGEFRAIKFVKRLIAQGSIGTDRYRDIRVHRIEAPEELLALSAASKQNSEPGFLDYLFGLGRRAAGDWLAKDAAKVGFEDGIDLEMETSYSLAHPAPAQVSGKARRELVREEKEPTAKKRR